MLVSAQGFLRALACGDITRDDQDGLCLIVFLLSSYLSVFYNLFNYLQSLGIPADLRGLVVGSFSVSASI